MKISHEMNLLYENLQLLISVGIVLGGIILYFCVRWYLGRRMRCRVYLCIDFFLRNCHEQSFYAPSHKEFIEYIALYKNLNRHKDSWCFYAKDRVFIKAFLQWFDMADTFIGRMSAFMSESHYFAHSEFLSCIDGIDLAKVTHPFINEKFLEYVNKKVPSSLSSIKKYQNEIERSFSDIPQIHNSIFIREELERNKTYFDTMLKFPLSQQQRESIVKMEDNCLVVSSAGSGKTATSVAKIKYLVEKRNILPSNILPFTYTKAAAQELTMRLGMEEQGLKCYTFHGLAYDIVSEVTGKKPNVCDAALMLQCFYSLISKDSDFKEAINSFLTEKNSLTKNEHDYYTAKEYASDRAKYGIQAPFLDMDGRIIFTKSEEEKKICTFLSMNNVSFRYEHPHPCDTATKFKRQYKPDFTIYFTKDGRLYYVILEHFGIDANGNVPRWFGEGHPKGYNGANDDYNRGIAWKRYVNKQNNVSLLETTSAMFQDGTIYEQLTKQLKHYGIAMRPLSEDEKFDRLVRRNRKMEDSILELITTFITLMKSNRNTPMGIMDVIKKENVRFPAFIERSRFMLERIFTPMYNEYQQALAEKKQMDYTDLILKATDICEAGKYRKEYDMILVDEFQDISIDRFRFLQSLRRKQPLTKLYSVGDDWQSIFRFSGSDLSLFNEFEKHFGYTEKCKMETTYRFGEPLIKLSSKFILENPLQLPKELYPNDKTRQTLISLGKFKDDNTQLTLLQTIVEKIDKTESVMLIGRYHNDICFIPPTLITGHTPTHHVSKVCIDGREIPFKTIHSVKGLEADHVILVNCSQDGSGFPSKISDDPILGYVLCKPEGYPFAEERRLFYVAITRAKKHAYVLYKETCPSPFVVEMEKTVNPQQTQDSLLCPWCQCGMLKVVKEGKEENPFHFWRLYRCTNNTAGCQYKWSVNFQDEGQITKMFEQIVRKTRTPIAMPAPAPPMPLDLYSHSVS